MRCLPLVLKLALAGTIALLPVSAALAQYLPPHVPGTICVTPYGWCWMQQGYPGSPCGCPDGRGGWVRGVTS